MPLTKAVSEMKVMGSGPFEEVMLSAAFVWCATPAINANMGLYELL